MISDADRITHIVRKMKRQFAMQQSSRHAKFRNFQKSDTLQRKRTMRYPLFVFSYGFLKPRVEYEERFSFRSDCERRNNDKKGTKRK